jgi:Protein of unknown function (DUF1264)
METNSAAHAQARPGARSRRRAAAERGTSAFGPRTCLWLPFLQWRTIAAGHRPPLLLTSRRGLLQCVIYDSNKPDARLIGIEYIHQ